MNKIYSRLAFTNIKNNKTLYMPYIISGMVMIAMFYVMMFLNNSKGLGKVPGADVLVDIMGLGCGIIAIFSYIFLFYTNSFIIKRRKKEVGIYNILGMEKRHITRVLIIETLTVALAAIVSGIIAGILFSKLLIMFLYRIINIKAQINFAVSTSAVVNTILIFGVLYFLTLIYNLMQVKLANPIELLRGGNVGEKEPKSKWLIAIIGLGCLAGGYYIAITTKSPLQVLSLFFVAVLLVIIGTYLLFISGSIVILKALRKNKKFYYNKKHFAAVSGMIYRMKQNAGGLASICVLSTMVLVVVSTTVSMYAGMEGELKQRYPSDISVYSWYKEVPADVNLDDALKEAAADSDKIIADSACNVKDSKSYTYFSWTVFREGTEFKPVLSYDNDISLLYFVTGDEIDEMETGFKESLNKKIPQLDTGSVAVYGTEKFNGDIINLLGKEFKVAAAEKTAVSKDSYMSSMYSGVYYVVVDSKATLAEIFNLNSSLGGDSVPTMLNNEIDYNLYGSSEDKLAVAKALDKHFEENSVKSDVSGFYEESRDANREQIYVLYGGLFFIGIFLGTMFLMVTVMIIFYKQISEGYDDKARYEIMEKVGMSNDEVKKSITSQVRMVFFLPCIAPMVATSVVFARSIFPTTTGFLNVALNKIGIDSINWLGDPKVVMISLIIYTIWVDVGYNVILFSAGIDGIPSYVYEAADLDGASEWVKFRKITWPLLGRSFQFVIVQTLISHFQMFAQFAVLILKDGPQNSGLVLSRYIYKMAFEYKDMGYASAVSLVLFVIIMTLSLIEQKKSAVDWEY